MIKRRIVILILILAFHFESLTYASTISKLELNPAEEYVLEHVEKGELAYFLRFPENNRILSADFLKKLLTGAISDLKVTEKGISIEGARIKEKIELGDTKIPFSVSLRNCIFEKDIDFSHTKFSRETTFSGVKLYGSADFDLAKFPSEADFKMAEFHGKAHFRSTVFSKGANFSRTKFFEGADFIRAKFSGKTNFPRAVIFNQADFRSTVFSEGANFSKAEFSVGADFSSASLRKADLSEAHFRNANFSNADLSEANLSGADIKNCLLWNVRGFPLVYEPEAGSYPYIPSIEGFPNLSALTYRTSPHGLVDLRREFRRLGYRPQEREISYALMITRRRKLWSHGNIWNKLESSFYLLFFELTCGYGIRPFRSLSLFLSFIPLFSLFYLFAFRTKRQKTGIWLIFFKERVLKATKEERPFKLTAKFPPRVTPTGKLNMIKMRILQSYRMIRIAFYFSLLSATTIGWREFNVGNWISRIQRREYTLRATGWVRTVSGLQSLISVYLIAIWVLTYFAEILKGFE